MDQWLCKIYLLCKNIRKNQFRRTIKGATIRKGYIGVTFLVWCEYLKRLLQFNYWLADRRRAIWTHWKRSVTRSRERTLPLKRDEIDGRNRESSLRKECVLRKVVRLFPSFPFPLFFFSPFSLVREKRSSWTSSSKPSSVISSWNRGIARNICKFHRAGDTRSTLFNFNLVPRIAI